MKTSLFLFTCICLLGNVHSRRTDNDEQADTVLTYQSSNDDDIKKGIADLGDLFKKQCSLKGTSSNTSPLCEGINKQALEDLKKELLGMISQECDTGKQQIHQELVKINDNLEIIKQNQHVKPYDCQDVADMGERTDGIYTIQPGKSQPFQVYCEIEYNKTEERYIGWHVIQRRSMGEVNFNRSWDEYKEGFGELYGEFWLGNEKIRKIAMGGEFQLHFEAREGDTIKNGTYSYFDLLSENEGYKLKLGDHVSGSAWLLSYASGNQFSTYDRDDSGFDCGETGGWWYRSISRCNTYGNLNGMYGCEGGECIYMHGIYVTESVMKIRHMNSE